MNSSSFYLFSHITIALFSHTNKFTKIIFFCHLSQWIPDAKLKCFIFTKTFPLIIIIKFHSKDVFYQFSFLIIQNQTFALIVRLNHQMFVRRPWNNHEDFIQFIQCMNEIWNIWFIKIKTLISHKLHTLFQIWIWSKQFAHFVSFVNAYLHSTTILVSQ